MNNNLNSVRKNISLLLDQSGLKKIEISKNLDIHRNQLRSYIKGESNLTCNAFCRILKFINIDIESIIAKKAMDSIYKTDHETIGSAVQKVYDGLSNLERKVLLKSLTSFTNGKSEVKSINDYFEKLFKSQ